MMTWILIIGGGLVLVLLIVGVIVSANSERSLVEERLGQYLDGDEPAGRIVHHLCADGNCGLKFI